MLNAWGDESAYSDAADVGTYLIAAALLFDEAVDESRHAMSRLQSRSEPKVHWRADSPARHHQVVGVLKEMPVEGFVVVRNSAGEAPERRRRKCLERLLPELDNLGCQALTLESRGRADDRRDMNMVAALRAQRVLSAGLRVDHLAGPKDPLLWLADALCGAVADHRRGETAYLNAISASVTVEVIDA